MESEGLCSQLRRHGTNYSYGLENHEGTCWKVCAQVVLYIINDIGFTPVLPVGFFGLEFVTFCHEHCIVVVVIVEVTCTISYNLSMEFVCYRDSRADLEEGLARPESPL